MDAGPARTGGNGGFPQDPALDLNPATNGVQATTGATTEPTLTLPRRC